MKYRTFPAPARPSARSDSGLGTFQMIWNILEHERGSLMIASAREHAPDCVSSIRVTHASQMLAEPLVISVLLDIYDEELVAELAESSDLPDLPSAGLDRIASFARTNFGVEEEPIAYKGTMQRMAS